MSLFIIEGIDGSGKTTQAEILVKKLNDDGYDTLRIKFPNYNDRAAGPIKMYLEGEFGTDPEAVNAYAASTFYAIDRYASYKKIWENAYKSGVVIISDRYVMSNIIHQSSKLKLDERKVYFDWLYDFEYVKLGLPKPDRSFFLDVPPILSLKQVEKRYNGDEGKKDIHERDFNYLKKCYEAGIYACEYLDIKRIECVKDGKIKDIDEINNIIYDNIIKIIKVQKDSYNKIT
ncbi:MAG: tmk [Clostridia bacterium]|nr:tmk [Clostridia bacterium]